MTITREITQPDRHNMYNAYSSPEQASTVVGILQGVTLVIGSVTLAAPTTATIYQAFRVDNNRAEALRLYAGQMTGATAEDLEDFIYLLDDTLSGPGVPGMAPGQAWTITYQTAGGAPNQSLLTRLQDRQASYGVYAHYQAIAGTGTSPAEGAIRIEYEMSSATSVVAQQTSLARLLSGFFESATPSRRDSARSSADYEQVFASGYVSFTNVRHREGQLFFALINELSGTQRSGAAQNAIRLLGSRIQQARRRHAESGAIQFMESQHLIVAIYDGISGQGLGSHGLTADRQRGFSEFDQAAKERARDAARAWRTRALSVVSGAGSLTSRVRGHLNNNVRACYTMYYAALYYPEQLPANMQGLYYSYLNSNPSDIWGAYNALLVPTSRQMADRLSYIILAAWDPQTLTSWDLQEDERPPGLSQAITDTLRSLVPIE